MMRRLGGIAALCFGFLWAWSAMGQFEDPVEGGGSSLVATAVGTCSDGSMLYDIDGVVRCGSNTTTDPSDVLVRGGACYELDATCTGPDLQIATGLDTKQFTTVTFANCAVGDTARVVVIDKTGTTLSNCDCAVGTTWTCATNDNTCAAGLDACVEACAGVSSQVSSNTVGVRPDDKSIGVTLSMPTDAGSACAVANNGTDGVINLFGSTVALDAGFGNDEVSVASGSTTVTGTLTVTGALDQRGAVSNSTGPVGVTDDLEVTTGGLWARTNAALQFQTGTVGNQYFRTGTTAPSVQVVTGISFGYAEWILPKTSSFTLVTNTHSGVTINNQGAAGNVPITLMASAGTGEKFRIAVVTEVAGDDMTVTSVGDDTLQLGSFTSGAADCIDVIGLGSVMECVSHTATQWICTCLAGTCDTTCP